MDTEEHKIFNTGSRVPFVAKICAEYVPTHPSHRPYFGHLCKIYGWGILSSLIVRGRVYEHTGSSHRSDADVYCNSGLVCSEHGIPRGAPSYCLSPKTRPFNQLLELLLAVSCSLFLSGGSSLLRNCWTSHKIRTDQGQTYRTKMLVSLWTCVVWCGRYSPARKTSRENLKPHMCAE